MSPHIRWLNMARGVKAGSKRGSYRRLSKSVLRKLARDVKAGSFDREAVAQAFESSNQLPDRLIAAQLRVGGQFDPARLAAAVESLAVTHRPFKAPERLPLYMAKAAMKHLSPALGGKGEPIHKALQAEYPYGDDPKVRAYYRRLEKDYGKRSKSAIFAEINVRWPERQPGKFPELEKALSDSLSGYGVPLDVWRSVTRKSAID
jgi:hypothetical protein